MSRTYMKALRKMKILGENGGETPANSQTLKIRQQRKTGRRKDQIWQHVVETDGGFICSYCQIFYTGGASRIKAHLSGKSGSGISPCPNVPSALAEQIAENCFGVTRSTSSSPERQHIHSKSAHPPVSTSLCVGSEVEMDNLLAKFLILNSIPLEIVDKPYFRTLVSAIASAGPNYEPPSYSGLVSKSLPILEKEIEQYIQSVRESWSSTGCTVKIHVKDKEYGDSVERYDIMGYIVYCPKGVIYFNPHDPSHSSSSQSSLQQLLYVTEKAMKKEALQTFYDVDREKTLDENLMLYVNSDTLHSHRRFFRSTVHICAPSEILNLLHNMCKRSQWLVGLLIDTEYAYKFLTTAESGSLMLRRKEKADTFIHDNPFSKLQEVMQSKTKLQRAFVSQSESTVLSHIINQEKFWQEGEEVLDAIGPLIRILYVFDSFVPNIGYFFGAMEKAEQRIEDCYVKKPTKFNVLRDLFRRLKDVLITPMHIAAAYLNPVYLSPIVTIDLNIFEPGICYLYKCLAVSEKEAFAEQFLVYTRYDSSLFTDTAISELETCHPVTWWDKFGLGLPILRKYAIQLLSQPSNCLSHLHHKDKFEGLDMVTTNAKMMEEFKSFRDTIFKPIDLSEIDAPVY